MSLSFLSQTKARDGPTLIDPRETFETFGSITCTISSFTPMTGTLYLSTYRLAFIETSPSTTQNTAPKTTPTTTITTTASGTSAAAANNGTKEVMVKQVSVPLGRYIDPVVVQPWFGANYYEGRIVPVAHGGLDNIDVSAPGAGTLATNTAAPAAATTAATTAAITLTNAIAALTGSSSSSSNVHGDGTGSQTPGSSRMMARFAFNEGGIERFHKALEHAYSVARARHRDGGAQQRQQQEEVLPLYESAGAGAGIPPEYQ